MIKYGIVDINTRDEFGNTAIHYAIDSDSSDVVAVLLAKGPKLDLSIIGSNGLNPLDFALRQNNPKIIKLFRDYCHQYFVKEGSHTAEAYNQVLSENIVYEASFEEYGLSALPSNFNLFYPRGTNILFDGEDFEGEFDDYFPSLTSIGNDYEEYDAIESDSDKASDNDEGTGRELYQSSIGNSFVHPGTYTAKNYGYYPKLASISDVDEEEVEVTESDSDNDETIVRELYQSLIEKRLAHPANYTAKNCGYYTKLPPISDIDEEDVEDIESDSDSASDNDEVTDRELHLSSTQAQTYDENAISRDEKTITYISTCRAAFGLQIDTHFVPNGFSVQAILSTDTTNSKPSECLELQTSYGEGSLLGGISDYEYYADNIL